MSFAAPSAPASLGRIILIDPNGAYTAYSIPQGAANYAHVDVRYPTAGTWTAYFALSRSSGFNGPFLYAATTANFTTARLGAPSVVHPAPGQPAPST